MYIDFMCYRDFTLGTTSGLEQCKVKRLRYRVGLGEGNQGTKNLRGLYRLSIIVYCIVKTGLNYSLYRKKYYYYCDG